MTSRPSLPVGGAASGNEHSKPAWTLAPLPGGELSEFRVTSALTDWGRYNLGCPMLINLFVVAPLFAYKSLTAGIMLGAGALLALLFNRDVSRYVRWELRPGRADRFISYRVTGFQRVSRYAVLSVKLVRYKHKKRWMVRLGLVTQEDAFVPLHPDTDRGRDFYSAGWAVADALKVEFHATPEAEECLGISP